MWAKGRYEKTQAFGGDELPYKIECVALARFRWVRMAPAKILAKNTRDVVNVSPLGRLVVP